MFEPDDYELLDFGNGRKLERFGGIILDRPAPVAEGKTPARPDEWPRADAVFHRQSDNAGRWQWRSPPRESWTLAHDGMTFLLKPTDFGHVGLFPEQAENWEWMAGKTSRSTRPLKVLNLFAYTGGATLAAAAAGAEVVHVDAARNIVAWARRNARLSGLEEAPIRWIVEDAAKFVDREVRRGNRYDAVLLDPPSYGHGPKGQTWKLTSDLPGLLEGCAELVGQRPAFFLLTCHTPGYGPAELDAILSDLLFGRCQQGVVSKKLLLTAGDGRRLPSGAVARWPK